LANAEKIVHRERGLLDGDEGKANDVELFSYSKPLAISWEGVAILEFTYGSPVTLFQNVPVRPGGE
jgi:hypothetical protein